MQKQAGQHPGLMDMSDTSKCKALARPPKRRSLVVSLLTVLLMLWCLTPRDVYAADWRVLDETNQLTWWLDVASLTREGDIVKAWTRTLFHSPQENSDGRLWMSNTELLLIDCRRRMMALKQVTEWVSAHWKGDSVYDDVVPDEEVEWSDIPPSAAGDETMRLSCDNT